MANLRDRIILFPRFTTLAGDGDWTTLPINVTGHESGDVMVWMGDVIGPTPPSVVSAIFEESTDQVAWSACGGTGSSALTSGQETQLLPTLTKAWMRLRVNIQVGVTKSIVSVYGVGYLVRRRGASPP